MREIWLRPNRRPLLVGVVVNVGKVLVGGALLGAGAIAKHPLWFAVPGGLVIAAGCVCLVIQARHWWTPRIAREGHDLLLYLGNSVPDRVPLEHVECFFLGQGPTALPATVLGKAESSFETVTIVVRLAEAAKEWHHRETRAELGHWCDGYITVRGTWCEPITGELVKGLNRRLVDVHRQARLTKSKETS